MKTLKKILVENGISPSMHRIKILEYLSNNRIHPTADDIYRALVNEIPTLSKTTVYNTLRTFTQKKILTALSVFESEIRYEYEKEPHIHFKCVNCGNIYDVNEEYDCLQNKVISGHKVLEHHVNLKGICKKCLAKEEG
jgi:Fe2+ or Zn2+ uptake regulation protein